ncbi:hypothetical protein [Mesorhizobium sp. SP-1A]|uniref:hypothetical protein n=1 Tax=Mesorhizobium sp. SP-1A TaxID=3077840 RepID=UPI0028F71D1E|nr:hypothetical protein [Mesorhizobium sp. SP-1A]
MMDGEEMYHAFLGALTDHAAKLAEDARRVGALMPIEPFDAETVDDERVRVVGVVTNPGSDCLDFVVLKTLEGGEVIPTTEGSVWPV